MLAMAVAMIASQGCKNDEGTPVVANYIFATPASVTMVGGRDTTVTLSGGIRPYVILQAPKSNIATISLDTAIIHIHSALSSGTDRIRIGDSAPSQVTVTIPIVVVQPPSTDLSHNSHADPL